MTTTRGFATDTHWPHLLWPTSAERYCCAQRKSHGHWLRNRREPKLRNIPTFPVQKLYLGSMHSHTTTNLFQFLNAANFPCQRNFPPIFCQYSRSKMLIETKMQPTTHVQRRPLKNEGRFFPMSINICTRETSLEFLETRSKESVSKRMLLMVQHSAWMDTVRLYA